MFMMIVSTLGGILKAVMVVFGQLPHVSSISGKNERKRGSHRFHGAGAKHPLFCGDKPQQRMGVFH